MLGKLLRIEDSFFFFIILMFIICFYIFMHPCLLGGDPLLAGSYVATIVFIFSLHTIRFSMLAMNFLPDTLFFQSCFLGSLVDWRIE